MTPSNYGGARSPLDSALPPAPTLLDSASRAVLSLAPGSWTLKPLQPSQSLIFFCLSRGLERGFFGFLGPPSGIWAREGAPPGRSGSCDWFWDLGGFVPNRVPTPPTRSVTPSPASWKELITGIYSTQLVRSLAGSLASSLVCFHGEVAIWLLFAVLTSNLNLRDYCKPIS